MISVTVRITFIQAGRAVVTDEHDIVHREDSGECLGALQNDQLGAGDRLHRASAGDRVVRAHDRSRARCELGSDGSGVLAEAGDRPHGRLAVGVDRFPGAGPPHEASPFDMTAKYADALSAEEVRGHLDGEFAGPNSQQRNDW
jgi:hypothetical protein